MNLKFTLVSLLLLIMFAINSNAQHNLFQQDFEGFVVNNMKHSDGTAIQVGTPACGYTATNNASALNSMNVDFNGMQNATHFLAVNPESPCGGFYAALVEADSMDFRNGSDSIIFECRYIYTSGLNWGPIAFDINIQVNSIFHNVIYLDTPYVAPNIWHDLRVKLPVGFDTTNVNMAIQLGGGEGVAVDDIKITGFEDTTTVPLPPNNVVNIPDRNFTVYPNPAIDQINIDENILDGASTIEIIDVVGKSTKVEVINGVIDVSTFTGGIYLLKLANNKKFRTARFVKNK